MCCICKFKNENLHDQYFVLQILKDEADALETPLELFGTAEAREKVEKLIDEHLSSSRNPGN